MSRPARGAFTLAEALVVIALLAVAVGLLLPAVQKVREAAARARCANNLRQLAVAFHGYQEARGHFPKGGTHLPPAYPCSADYTATSPAVREESWSWAYLVLPHVDQENLFRNPDPAAVRGTPVKLFHCPTRREPQAHDGAAKTDYAGCAGTHHEGANGMVMRTTLGVVRVGDVADGTANTVLLGEKRLNRAAFGVSADDDESYCTPGWNGDWEVYRWGAAAPEPDHNTPGDFAASKVFGSGHAGGFNCAFGDGSVRFIRYSVNPVTWQRVCARDDQQPYNPTDL